MDESLKHCEPVAAKLGPEDFDFLEPRVYAIVRTVRKDDSDEGVIKDILEGGAIYRQEGDVFWNVDAALVATYASMHPDKIYRMTAFDRKEPSPDSGPNDASGALKRDGGS